MIVNNPLPTRVRHEIRVRQLTVTAVENVTPRMRRITLGGPDLEGFTSLGFDDHVKMFFAPLGETLEIPQMGPDGLVFAGKRPPMREYTPRRYDPVAGTLDIDFVLHGDGPASGWAARAQVGDLALVAGPRGSMIVPDAFDWYLLAGDETALPAIARRIEELPQGARAIALVEVAGPEEEQAIASNGAVEIRWLHRNGPGAGTTAILPRALAALELPPGRGFAFVAAEARVAREAKRVLLEEKGLPAELLKAAGYWAFGEAEGH